MLHATANQIGKAKKTLLTVCMVLIICFLFLKKYFLILKGIWSKYFIVIVSFIHIGGYSCSKIVCAKGNQKISLNIVQSHGFLILTKAIYCWLVGCFSQGKIRNFLLADTIVFIHIFLFVSCHLIVYGIFIRLSSYLCIVCGKAFAIYKWFKFIH